MYNMSWRAQQAVNGNCLHRAFPVFPLLSGRIGGPTDSDDVLDAPLPLLIVVDFVSMQHAITSSSYALPQSTMFAASALRRHH